MINRCKRCVLPENYQGADFDPDNLCSLCRDFEGSDKDNKTLHQQKYEELEEIIKNSTRPEIPYDCIVPISGGWDSAYAAYIMKKLFGLRVLGLNIDNGYRSSHALLNLEKITDRLEINMVTLRPDPRLMGELFGYFLENFGYFCNVCNATGYILIGSFVKREAIRLGKPPLVVGGWSKKYEYQPGVAMFSLKSFASHLKKNKPLFEKLRSNILVEPEIFNYFTQIDDTRMSTGLKAFIQLPDYMDWDYKVIEKTLRDNLGMEKPEETGEHHYDCRLHPLNEYLKYRRMGMSQETIRNSILIREGRMTREEALQREEQIQKVEPEILQEALATWRIDHNKIAWDADWSGLW